MKVGPVQYARNGSVRLAYRVLGEAETPIVNVPGWVSNVDTYDNPSDSFAELAEHDLVPALATRGIHIRAGVHIGECEGRGDDWSGIAVHVGARVAALAGTGEVLASRTVRDLSAGSGLGFEDRGSHTLKGVPDQWQLFRVTAGAR